MEEDNPIRTEQCRAFYEHWRALGSNDLLPHTRDFVDRPDPALIPFVVILDVTERGPVFRFMGTALVELWGRDQTNTIFGAGLPEPAIQAMRGNCEGIAMHPCGMIEVAEFISPSGRSFQMESIMLPLAVDDGRPPRLCSFCQPLDDVDEFEDKGSRYKTKQRVSWIDLGFGIPPGLPRDTNLSADSVV